MGKFQASLLILGSLSIAFYCFLTVDILRSPVAPTRVLKTEYKPRYWAMYSCRYPGCRDNGVANVAPNFAAVEQKSILLSGTSIGASGYLGLPTTENTTTQAVSPPADAPGKKIIACASLFYTPHIHSAGFCCFENSPGAEYKAIFWFANKTSVTVSYGGQPFFGEAIDLGKFDSGNKCNFYHREDDCFLKGGDGLVCMKEPNAMNEVERCQQLELSRMEKNLPVVYCDEFTCALTSFTRPLYALIFSVVIVFAFAAFSFGTLHLFGCFKVEAKRAENGILPQNNYGSYGPPAMPDGQQLLHASSLA